MDALSFKKMDFTEFCAAAISVHQLEGTDRWEQHARAAYDIFEKEGNRVISVDELARVRPFHPSLNFFVFSNIKGKPIVQKEEKQLHSLRAKGQNKQEQGKRTALLHSILNFDMYLLHTVREWSVICHNILFAEAVSLLFPGGWTCAISTDGCVSRMGETLRRSTEFHRVHEAAAWNKHPCDPEPK